MFLAGIDCCRGGWAAFKVHPTFLSTSVELIDLPSILRNKPEDIAILAIDMPIGLLDGSRACDTAARRFLGQPRGTSVFAAPCRASLSAKNHASASATSLRITGRGLSQRAWGIASKIKQVDDAITPECQKWAFEVHPEVCFWALAGGRQWRTGKRRKLVLTRGLICSAPFSRTLNTICKIDQRRGLCAQGTCPPLRQVNGMLRYGTTTSNY